MKLRSISVAFYFLFSVSSAWAYNFPAELPSHLTDAARTVSSMAKIEIRRSNNHCVSFSRIFAVAAQNVSSKGDLLTVLGHVIIGRDPLRRQGQRGPYWMGSSNDSGFRSEFSDTGSPQVEHAMAGMILANTAGPGGGGFWGIIMEIGQAAQRYINGSEPNISSASADILLYIAADDLGTRLSVANMPTYSERVRNVLCL